MNYFIIGFIYGIIILLSDFLNPNREHWVGILIVATLAWPIHLITLFIKHWKWIKNKVG